MLRALAAWQSPAGARARLPILIFHRVLAAPDPLFPGEVDAQRFDAACAWLRRWYRVLPLDEAATRLTEGSLPSRSLAITFDDGYADNHTVALPILQRHGLVATFFVATGFLDGGCMWNDRIVEAVRQCRGDVLDLTTIGAFEDAVRIRHPTANIVDRRRAIDTILLALKHLKPGERQVGTDAIVRAAGARVPADLMMTGQQVLALAQAGMQLGGHTENHPILARLSDSEALAEIVRGRVALESISQAPITLFAYPNGRPDLDYGERDVALVRSAGFQAAVTTAWGAAGAGADPLQLPRFTPWDRTPLRFGLRMALNLRQPVRVCSPSASYAASCHPLD